MASNFHNILVFLAVGVDVHKGLVPPAFTLALLVPTLEGTLRLQAGGGLGGNQGTPANLGDAAGPGGGGGGGVLIVPATLPVSVVRDSQGAAAGTSLAAAVSEFPVNGATRGSEGEELTFVPGSAIPGCRDCGIPLPAARDLQRDKRRVQLPSSRRRASTPP